MHVTHTSNKQMQQPNKNAVEVAKKSCSHSVYQLKSLVTVYNCHFWHPTATIVAMQCNKERCNEERCNEERCNAQKRNALKLIAERTYVRKTPFFLESCIMLETFAAVEEFGSSNNFQMTFRSLAQHIPSNGFGWEGQTICANIPTYDTYSNLIIFTLQ